MDDQQKYVLPRYLNEPKRIAILTYDAAFVLLFPIVIAGMVFNHLLIGIVIGTICLASLYKCKVGKPHGFIQSLLYWHLPEIEKRTFAPPSHRRFYLG